MEDEALLIIGLIFFISIVGLIIGYTIYSTKKENEEQKEEQRKKETICCICGNCSMGKIVCQDCYNRSEVIEKEIPSHYTKNYLSTINFHKKTINNILDAKSKSKKEYYSILLIITSDILKEKYFVSEIWKNTFCFLQELQNQGDTISEDFRKKYYFDKTEIDDEPLSEVNTKDLSNYTTPYRCKDGHQVRSKAEREIDNFFFENRIFHIYEQKYEHPITKEWTLPDFYLPDHNLYIEYFGLTNYEYLQNREKKIKIYQSDRNIRFEYLTKANDENIYEKLEDICRKYNIPLK